MSLTTHITEATEEELESAVRSEANHLAGCAGEMMGVAIVGVTKEGKLYLRYRGSSHPLILGGVAKGFMSMIQDFESTSALLDLGGADGPAETMQ